MPASFSDRSIDWYRANRRALPWRKTRNPYRIWISEIILQQTRVVQGLPYYTRFVQRFPTLRALAGASQDEVLHLWQGLGYYSRARLLHACAKRIVEQHRGIFPDTYAELITLPGVGAYTAAAIASIAFDRPQAVVDGNVYRVLSRLFGIRSDISTREGKMQFAQKAQSLLDVHRPGEFNQAVMEFGALCCTAKNPQCKICIFSKDCFANAQGEQESLPHKGRKITVRNRYFTYFVFQKGKKIALRKRHASDIWKGLYDFYLLESNSITKPARLMEHDKLLQGVVAHILAKEESGIVKHVLSHQTLLVRFVRLFLPVHALPNKVFKAENLVFYPPQAIRSLPKSALITGYLTDVGVLPV